MTWILLSSKPIEAMSQARGNSDNKKDSKTTVEATLSFLNTHKLATNKPVVPPITSSQLSHGSAKSSKGDLDEGGSEGKSETSLTQKSWIQPSGPRKQGEGVENEEQGIVAAGKSTSSLSMLTAADSSPLRPQIATPMGPSSSASRSLLQASSLDLLDLQ